MAPAALDNANPTILSASELPTRKKRVAISKGPETKYTDLIFPTPSSLSRFYPGDAGLEPGNDDGEQSFGPEAIDEQEIYGMSTKANSPISAHDRFRF